MKQFREFIENISNIYSYREGCEWSNFWFDRATDEKSKRYLIIGTVQQEWLEALLQN